MIDTEQEDVRPSAIKANEIGTIIATSLQNKVRAISLSKFPVLSLLHLVFTIVGWLIVIGMVLSGIAALFQVEPVLGNTISAFVTAIVGGGFVLMLAELINIVIRIEGHLDRIRELQEREAFITSASATADALSGLEIAE